MQYKKNKCYITRSGLKAVIYEIYKEDEVPEEIGNFHGAVLTRLGWRPFFWWNNNGILVHIKPGNKLLQTSLFDIVDSWDVKPKSKMLAYINKSGEVVFKPEHKPAAKTLQRASWLDQPN